eukprot:scaffold2653_cov176-Ochromonas_danica.AAC.3
MAAVSEDADFTVVRELSFISADGGVTWRAELASRRMEKERAKEKKKLCIICFPQLYTMQRYVQN